MKCVGRPLYNIICVYALKHGQAPVSISYEIKFDLCTIVFGVLDVWKFCMDIKLVRLQMHRIFLSAFLTSFLLIAPVVFRTQKESNFLWYRISIYLHFLWIFINIMNHNQIPLVFFDNFEFWAIKMSFLKEYQDGRNTVILGRSFNY